MKVHYLFGALLWAMAITAWAGINEWTYVGLAPEQITAIAVHPTNPNVIYASALDVFGDSTREGGLFKTTDRGLTWDTLGFRHQSVMDVTLDGKNPETIWIAAQDYGAWRSTNGGANWENKSNNILLDPWDHSGPYSIRVSPHNSARLVLGHGNWIASGRAYFSEDGGEHWSPIETAGSRVSFVEFDAEVAGLAWLGSDDAFLEEVWMSTDTGRTFVPVNPDSNRGLVTDLRVTPSASGTMWYIAYDHMGEHITVTEDTGGTWQTIPFTGLGLDTVATKLAPVGRGDTVAVRATNGVPYITVDRGLHWQLMGPDTVITHIHNLWQIPDDSLVFWAAAGGIVSFTVMDTTQAISKHPRVSSTEYRVVVYPNPAASHIWLYGLPPAAVMQGTLHNVLGRVAYSFRVEAALDCSSSIALPNFLSSGCYFLQIRAVGHSRVTIQTTPFTIIR
jgi:photosystem II stability/assembly factor-like uncharacterized protein